MKKTMIAASIAAVVAAPVAFADVTVSGAAQQEFLNIDGSTVGWQSDSAYDINIKSTEDLGNGMKAMAVISLQSDYDGNTTNGRNDQYVGLSGDFGTVILGKVESFTEGKVAAQASVDSSENLGIEPGTGGDRVSNGAALAYVSPTVNGFHVAAACITDETIAAADDGGSTCDHTDVMVAYSNGPLSVSAGKTTYANTSAAAAAANGTVAGTSNSQQAIAVKYNMGDLNLVAVSTSTEQAGVDIDGYMVGATYAMGANKIGVGFMNQDTSATADEDQYIVDFSHALSKSTSIYVTYHNDDNGANADVDTTAIGVKHSF
jgi:predicted porin